MKPPAETALITGASSGIGLELARCFAGEGANLVLVARNLEALHRLAAELESKHQIKVRCLRADLSLPETPEQIFAEVAGLGVTVDVLVNNAGFGLQGEFLKLSLVRQVEMIRVNITALTHLTGLFLPGMIQRGRGGVLNVGSVAGFLPGPNLAVYYASKAFVLSFTEALAAETAGTGLRISVLCPGPTESNFGVVARGGKSRQFERRKMSAREVAQIGLRKFRAGQVVVVPGASNRALVLLPRLLPRSLARWGVKKYNRL
jgi:short-subunit dehydrogenase